MSAHCTGSALSVRGACTGLVLMPCAQQQVGQEQLEDLVLGWQTAPVAYNQLNGLPAARPNGSRTGRGQLYIEMPNVPEPRWLKLVL